MKRLLILTILLASTAGFAQFASFDTTYVKDLKEDVVATTREIVAQNLTLTEEQAKIFWPIFDEYMAAYDPIVEKRFAGTEEYMMNYYGMDDETAADLIKRAVEVNEDVAKLKKTYLNKMLEKLPATIVGKFFQIDARVSALVDLVRMASIPLVRNQE